MATSVINGTSGRAPTDDASRHRRRWRLAALAALTVIVAVLVYGYSYYSLPLVERPHNPLHRQLRPSGAIGLKLGIVGATLFLLIYLYPLRKRWAWLRSMGKTKNWLDFHVLMGIVAPILISLHSSFRFQGIAGMAFWIMWTVVLSGIIGRYLYSQIPRRLSAAEMTLEEIAAMHEELGRKLSGQSRFSAEELERLSELPDPAVVGRMSALRALCTMLWMDLARPVQIARLRRKSLGPLRRVLSLWGLLPLGEEEFESVMSLVRRKAWLSTKIAFLGKIQRVFHLWHVVHRPFSYSFAMLVVLHIGFVVLLGYY
ncbi:MAG: hypothetical protein GY953_52495 [bacterium]|nr:hypothetical protein [bacterium]